MAPIKAELAEYSCEQSGSHHTSNKRIPPVPRNGRCKVLITKSKGVIKTPGPKTSPAQRYGRFDFHSIVISEVSSKL